MKAFNCATKKILALMLSFMLTICIIQQTSMSLLLEIPELGFNHVCTTGEIKTSIKTEEESGEGLDGDLRMWHHKEMDVERAWGLSTGKGVVVAIIDTGIDIDNPEFAGRILPNSYNALTDQIGLEYVRDDHFHGTHVAGIIAAARDDSNDVSGIAPDAEILVIKVNIPENPTEVDEAAVLRGVNYAVENGADIINMSLTMYEDLDPEERKQAIEQAYPIFTNAAAKGVLLISATSNESNNWVEFPASHPDVIAVSATQIGGTFAYSLSNYGPETEISAPGIEIYSPVLDGEYYSGSGTSQAAPNVAGVAALIKSLHPEYTPWQIREVLYGTARDAGPIGLDERYGYGIVNAYGAVLGINALCDITYDYNDGKGKPITVKAVPGARLIEPYFPEREGFVFDGWHTISSANQPFDFRFEITEDTTIYAKWAEPVPGTYAELFPDVSFCREVVRVLNLEDGGKRTPASIVSPADFEAIATINILSLDSRGMEDLAGLEHFTGLTMLNVRKNRLTELDVLKFTALEMLFCNGNLLSALDIWNNPALEILVCDDNRLSLLDTSNNPVLETLVCYGNRLRSLDISNNAKLTTLYCQDNDMKFPADVAGWRTNTELILNDTFMFYPQSYNAWHDDVKGVLSF